MTTVQTPPVPDSGVRARAVAVLVAAVAATAVVAQVALHTRGGQDLDGRAMHAVVVGRDSLVALLSVLGRVSVFGVLALALVCAGLALARRSVLLALASIGLIAGANVTTQVLKKVLLERSTFDWDLPNSLPSGHTTVVAAGVGALFLVLPPVVRPLLALAGAFAITFTGSSTVVAGWHRPSDVIAAFGVCLAWTAVAGFVVDGRADRSGLRGAATFMAAAVGALLATLVLVALGARPVTGWDGVVPAVLVHGALAGAAAITITLMAVVSPARPSR